MGTVAREPSRDELAEQLRDERRKVASLEAKLASGATITVDVDGEPVQVPIDEAGKALESLVAVNAAERAKIAALEEEVAALKAATAVSAPAPTPTPAISVEVAVAGDAEPAKVAEAIGEAVTEAAVAPDAPPEPSTSTRRRR